MASGDWPLGQHQMGGELDKLMWWNARGKRGSGAAAGEARRPGKGLAQARQSEPAAGRKGPSGKGNRREGGEPHAGATAEKGQLSPVVGRAGR